MVAFGEELGRDYFAQILKEGHLFLQYDNYMVCSLFFD